MSTKPTILILSLSGIGNFLMHTPTFAALKKVYPNAELTVWVAPRGTKILAENDPNIDRVIVAPIKRPFIFHFSHLIRLLRYRYDIGIMLSPGQLWKGALYMFLAGIKKRIAHQYPHLGNPTSSFLLTDSIPEQESLHDIEQNLNLLKLVATNYQLQTTNYKLNIPPHHQEKAEAILARLNIDASKKLIGLHPGAAPGFEWKRWPLENFAKLAQQLIDRYSAHILIFGGPDEAALKAKLQKMINAAVDKSMVNGQVSNVVSADLLTAVAVIMQCQLFISNDSGLMHLAAATNTPTLGLFGPTDETLTGPRGKDAHTLRQPGTVPAYQTELKQALGPEPHQTLQDLPTSTVFEKSTPLIQEPTP